MCFDNAVLCEYKNTPTYNNSEIITTSLHFYYDHYLFGTKHFFKQSFNGVLFRNYDHSAITLMRTVIEDKTMGGFLINVDPIMRQAHDFHRAVLSVFV